MCDRYRMTANQAEFAARYGVGVPYLFDEAYPPPELFPKEPDIVVQVDSDARWFS